MLNLIGVLTIMLMTVCPCPTDTLFLAKYEWRGNTWTFAEGEDAITLAGDARTVSWTSTVEIAIVTAAAGQDCTPEPGGYSGSIVATGHDLSNLNFCRVKPTAVMLVDFGGGSPANRRGYGLPAGLVALVVLVVIVKRRCHGHKRT